MKLDLQKMVIGYFYSPQHQQISLNVGVWPGLGGGALG